MKKSTGTALGFIVWMVGVLLMIEPLRPNNHHGPWIVWPGVVLGFFILFYAIKMVDKYR